jgi:hypothetical protein
VRDVDPRLIPRCSEDVFVGFSWQAEFGDILCIERLFEELGDFRASTLMDKQADRCVYA